MTPNKVIKNPGCLLTVLLLLVNLCNGFSPSQVSVITQGGQIPAPPIDYSSSVTGPKFSYGPLSRARNAQGAMADAFYGPSRYYYRGGLYGTNLYPNSYDMYYGGPDTTGSTINTYPFTYGTGYGTFLERYKPVSRGYLGYGYHPYSYGRYGYGGGYYGYGRYPHYGGYGNGFGYNSAWFGRDIHRFPVGGYGYGYGSPYSWYGYDTAGYGPSFFGYGHNGLGGTSSNRMHRFHPAWGYAGYAGYGYAGYPGGYGYAGYPGGFYGGGGFGAPFYNQPGGMLFY